MDPVLGTGDALCLLMAWVKPGLEADVVAVQSHCHIRVVQVPGVAAQDLSHPVPCPCWQELCARVVVTQSGWPGSGAHQAEPPLHPVSNLHTEIQLGSVHLGCISISLQGGC